MMAIRIPVADQRIRLRFRYCNWHGQWHIYEVQPEAVEFGPYTEHGTDHTKKNWVLHAQVVKRDNVDRPGRRTFLLMGIEEIK